MGKITKLLEELNIEFEKLENPDEETEKLFDYTYNNNHYRINKDNLLQMFLLFGKDSSEEEFNHSNYSTILKSECKPLIDYISSNINTYVDNAYLKLGENKFEEEVNLIKLLNDENLSSKSKVKIIQKVETKVNEIWNVDELDICEQLLTNNKLVPTWKNVTEYYKLSENEISNDLITFLNFEDVFTKLSEEKMTFKSDSFDYASFREKLLLCDELSDESYKNLLKNSIYNRNALAFEQLNKSKVPYLVNNILNTTKSNYDVLRNKFPNNHIALVEKNFTKFIDKISDFETDEDDILFLLKSEKISVDNKFNYVSKLDEGVIVGSKEISKIAGNIILQKSSTIEFEYDTIESVIKNGTSSVNKIRLVNLYINNLDSNDIISLLKNIGGYDSLFVKGFPTYEKSDFNLTLFQKLKAKGIIKNYYDDKRNDSNFRVTTNY